MIVLDFSPFLIQTNGQFRYFNLPVGNSLLLVLVCLKEELSNDINSVTCQIDGMKRGRSWPILFDTFFIS